MPTIGKLLGMPENPRTYDTDTRLLALQKCNTGIEFEAENVRSNLPLEEPEAGFWSQKEDGSLRSTGTGRGMEFVLREPLFGNDLIKATKWFCDWATKNRLESNYRTGLHIHIDCRNMKHDQLVTMILYYAVFEKVIFEWVGDKRDGSIFCMPLYKAEGVLEEIVATLKSETSMRDAAKNINRYAAFNLNSLSRFGTVEWRHMQTTFNFDRVLKWINICQGFKRYARNNPLKPREILAELSKEGAQKILSGIVGSSLAEELWTPRALSLVNSKGLPIAEELDMQLNGTGGLAWNSVRSALGVGTNVRWTGWAEKQKKNPAAMAAINPFTDIEVLSSDTELQKEALATLTENVRRALDGLRI